jgi:hypothetical protein
MNLSQCPWIVKFNVVVQNVKGLFYVKGIKTFIDLFWNNEDNPDYGLWTCINPTCEYDTLEVNS